MRGPSGRFVLPEQLAAKLVFIATGTGIAPFISMIDYLQKNKCSSNINLYFGVRNEQELFGLAYLENFKNTLASFDYVLCYSQQTPTNTTGHSYLGRVTLAVDLADIKETQYFLCGNPHMITEMTETLLKKGVLGTDIFYEKFTVSLPKV